MKGIAALAIALLLVACARTVPAEVYNVTFTTTYSDRYILEVHVRGGRIDKLSYQGASGRASRMAFETFFKYEGSKINEIYTVSGKGVKTINYTREAGRAWPLVYIATLREDFEKDGAIEFVKVLFDPTRLKLVLLNCHNERVSKSKSGTAYMANEISQSGNRYDFYDKLLTGDYPLFSYEYDQSLAQIIMIN